MMRHKTTWYLDPVAGPFAPAAQMIDSILVVWFALTAVSTMYSLGTRSRGIPK